MVWPVFYLYIQSQGFILHSSDFLYQLPFSWVCCYFPLIYSSFFPWWNILWMSSVSWVLFFFLFTHPFLLIAYYPAPFMEFNRFPIILHSLTGSILFLQHQLPLELPIQVCIHLNHLPKFILPVKLPSLESPFIKLGLKNHFSWFLISMVPCDLENFHCLY